MKLITRLPAKQTNYKCLACDRRFVDKAGATQCPDCGHLYVKAIDA